MAAAWRLVNAGYRVTLVERRPYLGGRAYSFIDRETGQEVDNGQHVFLGCCDAYQRFLDEIRHARTDEPPAAAARRGARAGRQAGRPCRLARARAVPPAAIAAALPAHQPRRAAPRHTCAAPHLAGAQPEPPRAPAAVAPSLAAVALAVRAGDRRILEPHRHRGAERQGGRRFRQHRVHALSGSALAEPERRQHRARPRRSLRRDGPRREGAARRRRRGSAAQQHSRCDHRGGRARHWRPPDDRRDVARGRMRERPAAGDAASAYCRSGSASIPPSLPPPRIHGRPSSICTSGTTGISPISMSSRSWTARCSGCSTATPSPGWTGQGSTSPSRYRQRGSSGRWPKTRSGRCSSLNWSVSSPPRETPRSRGSSSSKSSGRRSARSLTHRRIACRPPLPCPTSSSPATGRTPAGPPRWRAAVRSGNLAAEAVAQGATPR